MQSLNPKVYTGSTTTVVIGIDVGTTFSSVSYAILRPGEIPQICPVTRFSDQTIGDNKIPSVIYYDKNGDPKAIGAATTLPLILQEAAVKEWLKAEHFKMHFHPHRQDLETFGLNLGNLPPCKTPESVMSDFLRYLVAESGKYISDVHGYETWRKVRESATFVIGHPNGWSGKSQSRYRESAVQGELVPDTDEGRKRVQFVTEGEASGLASLASGIVASDALKRGFRFTVVDAGGGTIDISTFEIIETSPLRLSECSTPDSRFAGSVFVNIHGKKLLQKILSKSEYDNEVTIDGLINDAFETSTKRVFSGSMDGLLQVGNRRENDKKLDISAGFLRLKREDLEACFEHSVSQTNASIRKQFLESRSDEMQTPVWLVGGFGNSPYLLRKIRDEFKINGLDIRTPNMTLSKVVSYGAILHFLEWPVVARICPTTYGTICLARYDPSCRDHKARRDLRKKEKDGMFIGPIFDPIAEKGSSIAVGKTFTSSYRDRSFSKKSAARCSAEILCYDGQLPAPYWYDENKDKFKALCRVEADLTKLWKAVFREPPLLKRLFNANSQFMLPCYDIELEFGATELEARIKWQEKGEIRYGPAEIIWFD